MYLRKEFLRCGNGISSNCFISTIGSKFFILEIVDTESASSEFSCWEMYQNDVRWNPIIIPVLKIDIWLISNILKSSCRIPWTVRGNSRLKTWHGLETTEDSDAENHSNHLTGDSLTRDQIRIQKIPVCSETCNSCYKTYRVLYFIHGLQRSSLVINCT